MVYAILQKKMLMKTIQEFCGNGKCVSCYGWVSHPHTADDFFVKKTLFSSYIHVKVINILQCIDNLCYHTVPKTLFFQDKRSDLIYARYNSIHAQYDSVDTR